MSDKAAKINAVVADFHKVIDELNRLEEEGGYKIPDYRVYPRSLFV